MNELFDVINGGINMDEESEYLMDEDDSFVNCYTGSEISYEVWAKKQGEYIYVGWTAIKEDLDLGPEDALKFWLQLGKALKLAGKITKYKITIEYE